MNINETLPQVTIEQVLSVLSDGQPRTAIEIARLLYNPLSTGKVNRSPLKKMLNRILYSLEKERKVTKSSDQPPYWSLPQYI